MALIKLPKTGPGIRYIDSELIKALAVGKKQDTARDPAVFVVTILDDKQKPIAEITCANIDSAEALMGTIAVICNPPADFPGGKRTLESGEDQQAFEEPMNHGSVPNAS